MNKSPQDEVANLVAKLKKSSAAQSLLMEQKIGKLLKKKKWEVVHSCYYTDTRENKVREIDLVGEQFWARKFDYINPEIVNMYAVVECKTAKGFHLLFSPDISDNYPPRLHAQWIGDEEDTTRLRLAEVLNSLNLGKTQVSKIIAHYNKIVYSDEEDNANDGEILSINIFPSTIQASAFRETNIGSEKDLEASVLWRAGLSLHSAISSLREDYLAGNMDDVKIIGEMETMYGTGDVVQEINKHFTLRSSSVIYYHPIVVVDCMLWAMSGSKIQQIDWCRLTQSNTTGFSDWWFDVVSFEHFDNYISSLTDFYKEQLLIKGAKRRRTK